MRGKMNKKIREEDEKIREERRGNVKSQDNRKYEMGRMIRIIVMGR
jgi:hypothetical protein